MMLTFEPADHVYRFNGVVVPSVTQILKPLIDYSMIPADTLEHARQEGVAIHSMIELECKDELEDLPDWLAPYYEAWTKFKAETGFKLIASETRLYHSKLHYAGTPDLVGTMQHVGKRTAVVVDIKRSLLAGPVIGLQLAGYQDAINDNSDVRVTRRFALQPRKTGQYMLKEFDDKSDSSTFLALLTIHKWKGKHAK